ncbi:MAG: hypothetical protein ACRCXB_05575 [Aeromonadaceae bacterium]
MAGLWYRTGTVDVVQGSKRVVGANTTWKTAINHPDKGNGFYGPDGKAYEIDYVTSDTELYLVDIYAGANASAQSYKIDVRGGTVPELSRQLSAHYAYMQGVIDSLQAVVNGAGDVTITGPDGQQVIVPSLANMLSKSGNLDGIKDKVAARVNLGLGDAATKSVGVDAGSVAIGNHSHVLTFNVGGDPSKFYPVRIEGFSVIHGFSISRDIHRDGTWAGSLRLHIQGTGRAWGGDVPYFRATFTQFWGGSETKAIIADIATSASRAGMYVWLRGGRTYDLVGVNSAPTIFLNGVIEENQQSYQAVSTGPLATLLNGDYLFGASPVVCYGNPDSGIGVADKHPVWFGGNFPVVPGAFTPILNVPGVEILKAGGKYWRKGDVCHFQIDFTIGSLADAPVDNSSDLKVTGLPFVMAATGMALPLTISEGNLRVTNPVAVIQGSEIIFFKKIGYVGDTIRVSDIKPKTYGGWVAITLSGWYPIA